MTNSGLAQPGSQCHLRARRPARTSTALGTTTALDVRLFADLLVQPALWPDRVSPDVAAVTAKDISTPGEDI